MEMLSPERYPSTLVARSSNRSSSSHMASTEATEPAPAAGEDAGEGGGAGGKEVAAADAAASPAAAAAVHRNSSDSLPGGLEMDPDLAAAEVSWRRGVGYTWRQVLAAAQEQCRPTMTVLSASQAAAIPLHSHWWALVDI